MEIRRSYDRLISTMGFPILVRLYLYIESGPRAQWLTRSPDTSIPNMLYVSCLKIISNYCYTHHRRYNSTFLVSACNTTRTAGTFPRERYKTMVGRYLQKPPIWLMTSHMTSHVGFFLFFVQVDPYAVKVDSQHRWPVIQSFVIFLVVPLNNTNV